MSFDDPITKLEWIKEHWYERYSLLVSLPAALLATHSLTGLLLDGLSITIIQNNIELIKLAVSLLAVFIVFIVWFISRRYPSAKRNRVGIALALRSDNKSAKQAKDDVVEKFVEIVSGLPIGHKIDLIILKDFQARSVVATNNAAIVAKKCRAIFVIWGKARNVRLNTSEKYDFDLSFRVSHRPLQPKEKEYVLRAFKESLVNKRWEFESEDLFRGIRITALNLREVSLYIIGVATFFSFDFKISSDFHYQLFEILQSNQEKRQQLSPIFEKVNSFLADSFNTLALIHFVYNKTEEGIKESLALVERALFHVPWHVGANTNKAKFLFLLGDAAGAKKVIKQIRKRRRKSGGRLGGAADVPWLYSEAFLRFLDEKYEAGLKSYKKALTGYDMPDWSLLLMIAFYKDFIRKNPDKVQFHYALGMIQYHKQKNLGDALDSLEAFINKAESHSSQVLVKSAQETVEEIKGIIGCNRN